MSRQYTSYGWRDGNVISHWGVTLDANKPTTGVITNHEVEFLGDAMFDGDAIDLAWEEHLAECDAEDHDRCGPQEHGTILIGSWKKDSDGKWEPDPDAKGAEYAAIVGELYTQVVWSKTVVRVRSLCSPCYPGQADVARDKIVSEGEDGYLAYDLPPDMYGGE